MRRKGWKQGVCIGLLGGITLMGAPVEAAIVADRVPLATYSDHVVYAYDKPNGKRTGTVAPAKSLVRLKEIRPDGWAYGSYRALNSKKRPFRWFRMSDLQGNLEFENYIGTAYQDWLATRTRTGSSALGHVAKNDKVIVVSERGESAKIIFRTEGEEYRMGWVPMAVLQEPAAEPQYEDVPPDYGITMDDGTAESPTDDGFISSEGTGEFDDGTGMTDGTDGTGDGGYSDGTDASQAISGLDGMSLAAVGNLAPLAETLPDDEGAWQEEASEDPGTAGDFPEAGDAYPAEQPMDQASPDDSGMLPGDAYEETGNEDPGYEDPGMNGEPMEQIPNTEEPGYPAGDPGMAAGPGALGDLNGDGSVDALDCALLVNHIQGAGTSLDESAADINGDGEVDMLDAQALIQMVKGSGKGTGDANGDGRIDARDVNAVTGYLAKQTVTINLQNADMNGDGMVDAADAEILRKLVRIRGEQ